MRRMLWILAMMMIGCVDVSNEATSTQAETSADADPCGGDPLLLDIGSGVAMSDVAHGVMFDIDATGIRRKVAWPTKGAWLVLDVNHNGRIDSGAELFGSASKAPGSVEALAAYDDNGDHVIDQSDPVFPALRVWIDKLRDGVSQPDELVSMAAAGVLMIDLRSGDFPPYVDAAGNRFLRASPMVMSSESVLPAWSVIPSGHTGPASAEDVCHPDPGPTFWRCYTTCYFRMKFFYEQLFPDAAYAICGGTGSRNLDGSPMPGAIPWSTWYAAGVGAWASRDSAVLESQTLCQRQPYQLYSPPLWDVQCEQSDRYGVWASQGGTPLFRTTCFKVTQ